MINFDDVRNENIKKLNQNCSQIPDHLHQIFIFACSESGKTNSLFNLINHQPVIDKIYLYSKDTYEKKYQLLINKSENPNDSKAFVEYSNGMDDIYENIKEYNPSK